MQIRELSLRELDIAYEIVVKLYKELSYSQFEDIIYDMRKIEYKMIALFDRDILLAYAGVYISVNLLYKRHLVVNELVLEDTQKHNRDMILDYIIDYAKIGMCDNIIIMRSNTELYGFELCDESYYIKSM